MERIQSRQSIECFEEKKEIIYHYIAIIADIDGVEYYSIVVFIQATAWITDKRGNERIQTDSNTANMCA